MPAMESITQASAHSLHPQNPLVGTSPASSTSDSLRFPRILPESGSQSHQEIYQKLVNLFRQHNAQSFVDNVNTFTEEVVRLGVDLNAIMLEASSEAGWLDALKDPLSPFAGTWIRQRQSYLSSVGKESQARDELAKIKLAHYVATHRDGYQKASQSPLSRESQLFFYAMLHDLDQLEIDPKQLSPILVHFYNAYFSAVAAHPLSPESEKAMQHWLQVQRSLKYFQHPETIMQDFEEKKLLALRSVSRTSAVPVPIRVTMGGQTIILTKKLGSGGYGGTFDAHLASQPNLPLVLKIMHDSVRNVDHVLRREKRALLKLDRLVAFENKHKMILFKKIQGECLEDILMGDTKWRRHFVVEYEDLSHDFYIQTGLIHGDIRPANVIVDKDKKLHLIDFGMTFEAPRPESALKVALQEDQDKAKIEYELVLARGKAHAARQNPLAEKSNLEIAQYAALLEMSDRHNDAARWYQLHKQLYGLQSLKE